MSSSVARAVHFVELAIIAQEGMFVIDGVPFKSAIQAELARRALAERAVAEASILCRYVSLNPSCSWCDKPITSAQQAQEIDGRLYHNEDDLGCGLSCAQHFEDECAAYAADHAAVRYAN